jgi:hypothetical protein
LFSDSVSKNNQFGLFWLFVYIARLFLSRASDAWNDFFNFSFFYELFVNLLSMTRGSRHLFTPGYRHGTAGSDQINDLVFSFIPSPPWRSKIDKV